MKLNLVDDQAQAVLTALESAKFPTTYWIRPFAYYNGRERWAGIRVLTELTSQKERIITFGENRSSDQIAVQTWERTPEMNPPSVMDVDDNAFLASYDRRKYFKPNEIELAVHYILAIVRAGCKSVD